MTEPAPAEFAVASAKRRAHPLSSWREPLVTFLGMAITVGLVSRFAPNPGALILAGVLTMTLSRNRLADSWRGRLEALVLLPLIATVTMAVGSLLKSAPLYGAALFVVALFVSIWLRRYGAFAARAGTLLALPFVTLMLVPGLAPGDRRFGPPLIALLALVVVVTLRLYAVRIRLLPAAPPRTWGKSPTAASSLRPSATTRMALQMALALALAFALGRALLPLHYSWVVLTAFIVCSGNRGRVDVLYKSGLRVLGALAGTLIATTLATLLPRNALSGETLTIIVLVILGIGLWLRSWSYALWALVMTLVASLLQGAMSPNAADGFLALWQRVGAIIVGAMCGLLCSWFLLPVRSEPVVRRRLGAALSALSEFLAEPSQEKRMALEAALEGLHDIARPWLAWERLARPRESLKRPGKWILLATHCIEQALHLDDLPASLRRTVGEARKALREPEALGPALFALYNAIDAEAKSSGSETSLTAHGSRA